MGDDILVINFEGAQTIEKSGANRDLLLKALKGKKKEIVIDLSKIGKVDLSFLQLLHATETEARSAGKGLAVKGEIPAELIETVSLAGYDRNLNDEQDSLFRQISNEGEEQ